MATEGLTVLLDADTAKLDKSLNSSNKKLDDLDKQTKKNDASFNKLTKTADAVSSALKVTATAGLALATALTAVVLKTAESEQELAILSRQAKLSTTDFEALAFATKQYGIDAEQIADISKDLSDKLGEFGKVGTGAFQDYADVIGLTKEEAQAAAIEFENMSSDQVIGAMVKSMEEAGASGNEMTFVLESMGNDLSRLIPLFTDNAKELDNLTSTYKSATGQMKLTAEEIKGLSDAATSFDLLTDSLREAGGLISAQIAPLLTEFFNGVITVVPDATQAIVDFINSFKSAENIESVSSLTNLIDEQKVKLTELEGALVSAGNVGGTMYFTAQQNQAAATARVSGEIAIETERLKELEEQLLSINETQAQDANRPEGGAIGGTLGGDGTGGTGDEITAIEDRFKTEEELLREKLAQELIIVGENNELKLQLEQEFQDNLALIRQQELDNAMAMGNEAVALFEQQKNSESKAAKNSADSKEKSDQAYLDAALSISSTLAADNEALQIASIVANTAAGIARQFADLPYPAALATSAAIAVSGAAQLANVGSGSISGTTAAAVPEVAEPTPEIIVSDTDASGESQDRVIVAATADEIALAINELMNGAKTSGVI